MRASVQTLYRILEELWQRILAQGIPAGALRDQLVGGAGGVLPPSGNLGTGYTPGDTSVTTGKIADDAVTFAKMQDISTNKLLGRSTVGTGDVEQLSIGTGLALTGGTLSASGSSSSLAWFNVTDYGAVGDGTTDDTSAINSAIAALNTATRGVLYFPAGVYKTTAALTTITAAARILGDGASSFDDAARVSAITTTSSTAVMFTITSKYARFEALTLRNTASTPSAGAAILTDGAYLEQRVDFDHLHVRGFYDCVDMKVGAQWHMDGCQINAPVRYGVRIRNTVNVDAGDWAISNSFFNAGSGRDSDAAIRLESGGGGKIVNCKVNTAEPGDTGKFNHGIDLNGASISPATSILLVSNTSIENYRGDGIHIVGPDWTQIVLHGLQFGQYSNTTGSGININTTTDVVIDACHFRAPSGAPSAITLVGITRAYIGAMTNDGYTARLTQTTCTSVIDASTGAGGTASGDLSGTYPNPTVAKIQGRTVSSSAPSTNDVLKWSGTAWAPGVASTVAALDDLTDVATSGELAGDRLRYNGTLWVPSAKVWQPLTNGSASSPDLIYAGGDVIMVEV